MTTTALWNPDGEDSDDKLVLVNGTAGIGVAITVPVTAKEIRRNIQRMKADTRERLKAESNRIVREALQVRSVEEFQRAAEEEMRSGDGDGVGPARQEWEHYCGNVVVLYCLRWVLDGRPIPVSSTKGAVNQEGTTSEATPPTHEEC